jgi:hypothetical protein
MRHSWLVAFYGKKNVETYAQQLAAEFNSELRSLENGERLAGTNGHRIEVRAIFRSLTEIYGGVGKI